MPDKRTVKTLYLLRTTLTDMIKERDDVYFSVKEVTKRAGVNRKTFYLHFNCIEELYDDLEMRTEEKLMEILTYKDFFKNKFSLKTFLNSLVDLINTDEKLYSKLLIEDKYKFLFRNIKNKIKNKIIDTFPNLDHSLKSDMQAEFIFSGLIKLFRVWHQRKDEMGQEEMLTIAHDIAKNGIISLE